MAATGKGKRKVKGKTLDLNSFLGDQNAPTGYAVVAPRVDWADSVEEEEKYSNYKNEKLILPTAPKAARGPDVDLSKIPTQPPFTAFVGNLPYDIAEDDITRFFGALKVLSVRLPRDGGDRGRMRGFGYAEFEDRQSLIEALSLNGETLKNRPIKVSMAGEHENDKDRKNDGPDRTAGDWRAAPRGDDSFGSSRNDRQRNGNFGSKFDDEERRNGENDREPYKGRSSYDDNRPRDDDRQSYQGRKSYERSDRDYGFGRDRERDRFSREGGREGDSSNYSDRDRGYKRYGDRGFDSFDRDNRDSDRGSNRRYGGSGGGGGGGFEDRNRSYGSRNRRDDEEAEPRKEEDRGEKDGPKERPKLQLKPRTVPVEQTAASVPAPAPSTGGGSSIFGAAKPVNTAAREREIEMRLAKEKLAEPERSKFSSSNRYGDRDRALSNERNSSYRRDGDSKYSDSKDSKRGEDYSPKRRYNEEPLREMNSRGKTGQKFRDYNYGGEADFNEDKPRDEEEGESGFKKDLDSRESRPRIVKSETNESGVEQENDEPVQLMSNKFAHLLDQEESD